MALKGARNEASMASGGRFGNFTHEKEVRRILFRWPSIAEFLAECGAGFNWRISLSGGREPSPIFNERKNNFPCQQLVANSCLAFASSENDRESGSRSPGHEILLEIKLNGKEWTVCAGARTEASRS